MLRVPAAALSFTAALIHLWVLPDSYLVWETAGLFFLTAAGGQLMLGVSLLFGPGRRSLRLGMLLNGCVVFAWAFTRAVGIPAWVGAFMREPVGALDLVATAAEVTLVILLARLRRDLYPERRARRLALRPRRRRAHEAAGT